MTLKDRILADLRSVSQETGRPVADCAVVALAEQAKKIEALEAKNAELLEACRRKNEDGYSAYQWGFDLAGKLAASKAENARLRQALSKSDKEIHDDDHQA